MGHEKVTTDNLRMDDYPSVDSVLTRRDVYRESVYNPLCIYIHVKASLPMIMGFFHVN